MGWLWQTTCSPVVLYSSPTCFLIHCSGYQKSYYVLTRTMETLLPASINSALQYAASPGVIIPVFMLLGYVYIYITRVINLIFILLGLVHVCTRRVIISLSYFGCGYQVLLHSHPLVSSVVPMLLYHMWPSCYPSRWHHSPCLATGWPSTTWCPRAALSARPTTSWRWCWNTWAPPVSCATPRQTNMSHLQTHSQAESATSVKEHYFLTWCKQSELF